MSIFSIADLHLSTAVNKPMDKFGYRWQGYTDKLIKNWRAIVNEEDTVIIPGDISWGISLKEALSDLKLISSLPGRKILGKGNHDYWWSTITKMNQFFEENEIKNIDFLHNNAFQIENYIIAGSRGWYIDQTLQNDREGADYRKIIAREAARLEISLNEADVLKKKYDFDVLCYLHFPPIFGDYKCREIIEVLKKHSVKYCYFGHIHGKYNIPKSSVVEGIRMTLISADFLNFIPMITVPYDY